MLRVTPIHFTTEFEAWGRLLSALGMSRAISEDGWWEFDSHSGGVRLHTPDEARPAGSTGLAFEVGRLEEFTRRTREAGTEVVITHEGHGPTAHITGPDGVTFIATAETRAPVPEGTDASLHVVPVWNSPDVEGAEATLRHIGARPDPSSTTDAWRQFNAKNGGRVGVHAGPAAVVELGFQYAGSLEDPLARLTDAGVDASLAEEPPGRALLVANPDGGAPIWVTEVS